MGALAFSQNSRGDLLWRKNIFESTYYSMSLCGFHMSSITLSSWCVRQLQHVLNLCVYIAVCVRIIGGLCACLFQHRYSVSSGDKSSYGVAVGLDSRETMPLLKLLAAYYF